MESFRAEDFDFDAWSRLATQDPEVFEMRRRMLIEQLIQSAPDARRARLKGLQFRLDLERRRARTPLAACLRISDMMWQALLGPGGLQASMNQLINASSESPRKFTAEAQPPLARVIPFPDRMHTTS
ncbi:DUF3135 domain-containing protein [Thermithiobacillus plumbiphilus]|uniref:DUF3135 domain-containing protein n=1 Tax=Thermithiobacillus plumbiphilus TaxID=1729899 RepID=A0ABU9DA60_9PROT